MNQQKNIINTISFLLLFLSTGLITSKSYAQFYSYGEIEYERNYNFKQAVQLEEQYQFMRQFAKQLPESMKSYYSLRFDQNKTEFKYERDTVEGGEQGGYGRMMRRGMNVASQNKVWTDLNQKTQIAIKEVFENTYYISDSNQKFEWKIEDDVRTIAGYPCRKAVTKIHDSVVVVAFYSDQIMVSGGPEGFNGLPGMILGLVIPRLYTTWFATNVTILKPQLSAAEKPKKVKDANRESFEKDIINASKAWRGAGTSLIWMATL